ncbi:hypothetical protein BDZ97DRAFT_1921162 [Flammula alnicola]|nr:hypothetical protein BDZ97DRAFT_1921162 [Flammula alnicola]
MSACQPEVDQAPDLDSLITFSEGDLNERGATPLPPASSKAMGKCKHVSSAHC